MNLKSVVVALSFASFSACTGAGAADLSPAVQAGVSVSFGGPRDTAPKAALQFATGYALGSMKRAMLDELRLEDRPPTRLAMVSLFDGRFSGQAASDAIRVAGFTVTRPGAPAVDAYGYEDGEERSSWWGRNWWWVTLAAIGAGAATALAGGGSEVEINANNGNGPSGDDQPQPGNQPCSNQEICVCAVDQICVDN